MIPPDQMREMAAALRRARKWSTDTQLELAEEAAAMLEQIAQQNAAQSAPDAAEQYGAHTVIAGQSLVTRPSGMMGAPMMLAPAAPAEGQTPRTDVLAAMSPASCGLSEMADEYNRMLDHARALERELAAAKAGKP